MCVRGCVYVLCLWEPAAVQHVGERSVARGLADCRDQDADHVVKRGRVRRERAPRVVDQTGPAVAPDAGHLTNGRGEKHKDQGA
eukprot:2085005-Pleurochrysis_carterae.AAC.2